MLPCSIGTVTGCETVTKRISDFGWIDSAISAGGENCAAASPLDSNFAISAFAFSIFLKPAAEKSVSSSVPNFFCSSRILRRVSAASSRTSWTFSAELSLRIPGI